MKHPVDTSQWGEFVVGELFDVHPTKAYKLKNSELLTTSGKNPVVVNSSYNNGIGGYTAQELTESGGILTFSDTTSGADTLFFQEKPFVGYPHVQGMYPKAFQLTTNVAKFMIASLRASINKYSWNYTNKLTRTFISSTTIKLPLKPSADPSNYDSTDIDWDYMETVMSRVTARAKDRLANLPQPTNKKKTLIDTSAWGEFVVGELFDKCDLKRIKPDFNKHADLSSTPSDEFNLPLINAKVGNNGIMYYGRSSDWESETMTLDIVQNGAASTGLVYAQPQATGILWDAYQIKLKPSVHENLTVSQLLFLATTTQASIQNKFSYENKAIWNKVQKESIKLPLKPSANPSNYTQEDIDWDYMNHFMQAIKEKAHERVASLKKQI